MTVEQRQLRGHLWLVMYNEPMRPIAASLCDEVFDLLDRHFDLGRGLYASYGSQPRAPVKDPRQWLHEHARRLEEESSTVSRYVGNVCMWKPRDRCPTWTFLVLTDRLTTVGEDRDRDPCLIVGVDIESARGPGTVRAYAHEVAALLLRRPESWYGFLNAGLIPYVGRSSSYWNADGTMARWESFVEQCYWHKYALATRDRVRGIYWGNMFGSRFAKRIVEADYLRLAADAVANWPEGPITITDASTGAMAVFLDNDPVRFARQRETGFDLGTMSGAVMSAGMLKDVLSRARML